MQTVKYIHFLLTSRFFADFFCFKKNLVDNPLPPPVPEVCLTLNFLKVRQISCGYTGVGGGKGLSTKLFKNAGQNRQKNLKRRRMYFISLISLCFSVGMLGGIAQTIKKNKLIRDIKYIHLLLTSRFYCRFCSVFFS